MARPSATDWVICKACTHTENSHKKHDGRSTKDRPCYAYLCDCAKFEKK